MTRSHQSGAALLIIMLVVVVSASFVLLSRLNASALQYVRLGSSMSVLNEAKAALIGYALNYPETHPGEGPGFLPCPDLVNDGSAGGACSLSGNTTIGRFPWKTLESGKLTDKDGEVLWYAVADNYRNNPKISKLNSDVAGNFSVNSNSDIVAVIFAPGAPLTSQDRGDDPLDVANYLEDDNADYDSNFVTNASGEFNDAVVFITRQELMSVVEKRVLGDVSQALGNYQDGYNSYPWLSPFDNPTTSAFRGQVNTIEGHLPFHWTSDPDSIVVGTGNNVAGRNPFTTDITLSWSITNANVTDPGTTSYGSPWAGYPWYNGEMVTPDQDCIESNICTDGNYPGSSINSAITFTDASCTWSNKDTFQCTGTYINTDVTNYPEENPFSNLGYCSSTGDNRAIARWDSVNWVADGAALGRCNTAGGWYSNTQVIYAYTETVERTYTIDITFTDDTADGADIVEPTSITVRTRDIVLENNSGTELYSTGTSSVSITIDEARTIEVTGSPSSPSPSVSVSATRVLTNDTDTTGTISATGLQYDIDIDDLELPEWFVENGWQDLIYIAYASGEALPGDTTDTTPADGDPDNACIPGTDCINVNINGLSTNDIRAVVINAGEDLTGSRPSGSISDYYEGENASTSDDLFEKSKYTSSNNDQLRVIATAP